MTKQMMAGWHDTVWRRYVVVGVLVVGAALGTWGLRAWHVQRVQTEVQQKQADEVREALAHIRADFAALQRALLRRAEEIATQETVVRGLRTYARQRQGMVPQQLVSHFAALDVPAQSSVELYDPMPRLVAWHGFGMPLGEAPNTPHFLQKPQLDIVTEGERRQVLVAWHPVREGRKVLGAVRALETVRYRAPVENEYLQDQGLAQRWSRETKLEVNVRFGQALSEDTTATARPLRGATGGVLGRVVVHPPSAERLVRTTRARYDDVLAFWVVLLLFWGMVAGWVWYRAACRGGPRPGEAVHAHLLRVAGRFGVIAGGWWGVRYVLMELGAPGRWQTGKAPLAPLFDPAHMASTLGGGLMRSAGDMLVTALFAAAFGGAFLHLGRQFRERVATMYRLRERLWSREAETPSPVRFLGVVVAFTFAVLGIGYVLATLARHALLDSTLDFFVREELLPDPLVFVVFCALLLASLTALMLVMGMGWMALWLLMRYRPTGWSLGALGGGMLGAFLGSAALVFWGGNLWDVLPLTAALALLVIGLLLALASLVRGENEMRALTLRNVLLGIFLVTVTLYPMLDQGMDVQRRLRMRYAAASFADQRDPRVVFAVKQVLRRAQNELAGRRLTDEPASRRDSLANALLRESLLSSLSPYDVSIAFFDTQGRPLGRSFLIGRGVPGPRRRTDSLEFSIVREMYEEMQPTGPLVEQITGRREHDRFQYVGILPIRDGEAQETPEGWIMVRTESQAPVEGGNPFPRVLLPAGLREEPQADLSLAAFQGRTLVRSTGGDFGRYRLDREVAQRLLTQHTLWRIEDIKDRQYLTFYQRRAAPEGAANRGLSRPGDKPTTIAVRMPALSIFDHLYFLLRLTVAGLFIGMPVFLVGLYLRYRAGQLPAQRIRFRDKVLNSFLGVGLVTVAAVGFVGLQVVTGENERAIQSWLRQYLDRVEETLLLETRGDERPYRVLDRLRIDSLSARVGLDLNLYTSNRLVATSRPQLVRENLVDERLPIEAVEALYYDGYRYTFVREQVGSFDYTTGFRALLDEQGRPRYVVAVPTLPEQERIEEERARTVAYLFGALLLLVLVVMMTASIIASALTRPLARLRSGLEAVARGRFEQAIPVSTRDEIGELVQTFNTMRRQLAESRRKLAKQERQLAWREMARQVAHEIKNPLTPMKLSIQHLRRAFKRFMAQADEVGEQSRFAEQFDRITSTLIEQIDALARIANEFHSFARMPRSVTEPLDLNEVVREALSLMREEERDVDMQADLHDAPLVVEADHEELRRIYINLIKNAIQAIPEGRRGRVEVSTAREEGEDGQAWARSSVADNGTGIAPEVREKIFEPNFSTKTSGTGLGLALAEKGVSDMNGTIDFETTEGEGTTFYLRLPLKE